MKHNLPSTWTVARISKNVPDLRETLEELGFRLSDDSAEKLHLQPPYVVANSDDMLAWEVAQGPAESQPEERTV